MIVVCPNCARPVVANDYDSDVMHACDSSILALDQEDRPKLDSWIDEETKLLVNNGQGAMDMQGNSNQLFGTYGGWAGYAVQTRNVRGNRVQTNRTRQHFEFIELK